MRITSVTTRLISIDPRAFYARRRAPQQFNMNWEFPLLEIATDSGLKGYSMGRGTHGEGRGLAHAFQDIYGHRLIGRDPINEPEALWQMFRRDNRHLYSISDAPLGVIDVALWDIRGKAAGLPLATLLGRYRKMHIPDDPCFYEKFYFTPGDTGFRSFQTRYARIGVLICWDQWFPEAARLTALSGAEILFYPTAIGFQEADRGVMEKQASAWQTIQRSHAIANGVFLGAVNRVGVEDNITFWGRSFISDPFGEVLAQASDTDPEILVTSCDLTAIEDTRQGWPFFRDRRVDAYQGLNQIFLDPHD